jgi:glycerol-3-phosphate dehydrogenase
LLLVHGGVRYLEQGNIHLVIEALKERGLLAKNAGHLVKNQSFIIPNYNFFAGLFYTIGLTVYDLLAGRLSLGRSKYLSRKKNN